MAHLEISVVNEKNEELFVLNNGIIVLKKTRTHNSFSLEIGTIVASTNFDRHFRFTNNMHDRGVRENYYYS